ncbi:tetratricopeptide repeat protein, partial [Acidobacteriota bacterium]
GSLDGAIEFFTQSIQLDPGYYDAYVYLGMALFKKKRDQEALSALSRAIEIDPEREWAKLKIAEFKKVIEKESKQKKKNNRKSLGC